MIIAVMDRNLATVNNPLLSKLLIKQGGHSDYKFAKRLGITRPLWQLTRTGRLRIGLTLLKAIAQTYPDMDQDLLNFLKDSIGKV